MASSLDFSSQDILLDILAGEPSYHWFSCTKVVLLKDGTAVGLGGGLARAVLEQLCTLLQSTAVPCARRLLVHDQIVFLLRRAMENLFPWPPAYPRRGSL